MYDNMEEVEKGNAYNTHKVWVILCFIQGETAKCGQKWNKIQPNSAMLYQVYKNLSLWNYVQK